MIGRTEIAFSEDQIARARKRVSRQKENVETVRLLPDRNFAESAEELLAMMRDRLLYLQSRHNALLATVVAEANESTNAI